MTYFLEVNNPQNEMMRVIINPEIAPSAEVLWQLVVIPFAAPKHSYSYNKEVEKELHFEIRSDSYRTIAKSTIQHINYLGFMLWRVDDIKAFTTEDEAVLFALENIISKWAEDLSRDENTF